MFFSILKFVYLYNNYCDCFFFFPVPSNLITSVSLSFSNQTGIVGSSATLTCMAVLSVDVSGVVIEFDYKLGDTSVETASGSTLTNTATISIVALSSAGYYTCTVTVAAFGVCGGGSRQTCPTLTSDVVLLTMQCEWWYVYVCALSVVL